MSFYKLSRKNMKSSLKMKNVPLPGNSLSYL